MKRRILSQLACPDCQADLTLDAKTGDADVQEGELRCQGCQRRFPIVRGVPRLLSAETQHLSHAVAASFAWEWNTFDEIRPHYHQQFLDWVAPLQPEDFRDKVVLEGGCGKGRHSALVAGYGARDVFALDLGDAVEAAQKNTGHLDNVHVIQADMTRPPLKRVADVAFSVGVLHHLPVPSEGFSGLVRSVHPGGRIAIWVYGREGNEWIVNYVDWVRMNLTSKLPRSLLYKGAVPPALLVTAMAHLYRSLSKSESPLQRGLHERLFYKDYLTYIADFPFREIHSIVFDHLVTPVAHYLSREDVEALFANPALGAVSIAQHNGNSWRGTAQVLR